MCCYDGELEVFLSWLVTKVDFKGSLESFRLSVASMKGLQSSVGVMFKFSSSDYGMHICNRAYFIVKR